MNSRKYYLKDYKDEIREVTPVPLTSSIRVIDLLFVYHFVLYPNFKFLGESHNYYELWICLSGTVESEIDGKSYTLHDSEFTISRPNLPHRQLPKNGVVQCLIISFAAEGLNDDLVCERVGKLSESDMVYVNCFLNECPVIKNQPNVIRGSIEEKPAGEYAENQMKKNLLEAILIRIIRGFREVERKMEPTDIRFSEGDPAADYIKKHYLENITLEEIADHVNYSVGHLCRKFKEDHKETIIDYITRLRILYSMKLLMGDDSIRNIAVRAGFKDAQYFTKVFKKQIGMTPKKYRDKTKSEDFVLADDLPSSIVNKINQ